MAKKPRLIESLPSGRRTTPMKVLCLGLSRTGTDSVRTALNILGYKAYHMYDVITLRHGKYWVEAQAANLSSLPTITPRYTHSDFEKLLHDFDALSDMPMALFVDDFLAAYPEVKVILTLRDFDSWMKSLDQTLFTVFKSRGWSMLYHFDWSGFGDMQRAGRESFVQLAANGDFSDREQLRLGFEKHYEMVRKAVPKHRLLEFKNEEGWEPLCKFLGKEVPREKYPRTNDAKSFGRFLKFMFVVKCVEALVKVVISGAAIALIVAVVWNHVWL